MSAFIVSNRTITQAIQALGESRCFRYNGMSLNDIDDIKTLGDELFALNAAAVSQRYREPQAVYKYRFEATICNKFQALKSLQCLLYQCTEGDIPSRPLYKALDDCAAFLMYDIVSRMPEYEAAKWDADDPTHDVKTVRMMEC